MLKPLDPSDPFRLYLLPPTPHPTNQPSSSLSLLSLSILKDFNACQVQGCHCRLEPRSSQFSEALHVHSWSVSYAPDPQNIRW